MKTNDKHSAPVNESLLKAIDKPCDIDNEFLNRLGELSAQEFEQAAESDDAKQPGTESTWRYIMKNRMTQLTSAAAVLIVALAGIHFLIGTGTSVTFAQVVKPILNATTISYDFIVGDETDGVVMQDIVTENRIRRTMGQTTMIIDMDNQKMLSLDNTKNVAVYLDIKGPLGEGTQIFTKLIRETIRNLQQNEDFIPEELGKQEIDGRKAIGFRTGGIGEGMVIWADAKTAAPIRIELKIGQQMSIIKNFQFNIPVDVSLFSMEVPVGYTLEETQLDLSSATEEEFIAGLKIWIEVMRDGQFPEAITSEAYMKDIPLMEEKVGALNLPAEEAEKLGIQYIKGMMFINLFPVQGHSNLHYAGKGVTYGDHEQAVFWYKPKGSENYRVIYGDLSVKEVTAEQLPK
jgi:outer membrane lipoprotein-sorting protein